MKKLGISGTNTTKAKDYRRDTRSMRAGRSLTCSKTASVSETRTNYSKDSSLKASTKSITSKGTSREAELSTSSSGKDCPKANKN